MPFLSFMRENEESLDFRPLSGQRKGSEDASSGSGKLQEHESCVLLLTGLSQQGSAGQGGRLVRWVAGG